MKRLAALRELSLADATRTLTSEWLEHVLPQRPPTEVVRSSVVSDPMGSNWLYEDCEITETCPRMPWGGYFVRCSFRPLRETFPFYCPLVLKDCTVELTTAYEGLDLYAEHTQFSAGPEATPRIDGSTWLHDCVLVDAAQSLMSRKGLILSGPGSLARQQKSSVPDIIRSGWELGAWFSARTRIPFGGTVERFDPDELARVREMSRHAFERSAFSGKGWLDGEGGGFLQFLGHSAVIVRRAGEGLEFWMGGLAGAFAEQALETSLRVPLVVRSNPF